ncbi:hypothetical protein [Thalassospira sp. TSL5-1]|uniref:hypothetical protein n=1 Tax=Thalassospira sp. TSL5-1 TaxID=1544451 RepID=UPI00093CA8E5|nr:hypothetical protein [Thalassospira sp. TSL5-1]OKH89143.1 hypothetical protein LF95_03595 [Thalassospira sp. TSL5-1]
MSPALRQDFFQGSIWENGYAVITNFLIVLAVFDYAFDKHILPRLVVILIMLNTAISVTVGVSSELYENWDLTTQNEVLAILVLTVVIYGSILRIMYRLIQERGNNKSPLP